jgi:AraC-like DNA-binding protein
MFSTKASLLSAQDQLTMDSLLQKRFAELFQLAESSRDSAQLEFFANVLVKKGELMKEKHGDLVGNIAKCIGYHKLAKNRALQAESLAYADSIIQTMGNDVIQDFPTVAYQIKGDYYFARKGYKKALENYLNVLEKANVEKSEVMLFRGNNNLADLKRQIGKPEESLELYKKSLQYIQETKDSITITERLITIASIANVYNDQQNVDSASVYNRFGMKEAARLNSDIYLLEFALNQGITQYHNKKFQVAIDSFEKHIPSLKNYENSTQLLPERLALSYFFNGKSYLAIGNQSEAIRNFKAIDSLFTVENSLFPLVRESYEYLIKYYKNRNDQKKQLQYINQLIKVDSILYADKLFLNKEIVMEYDVPKLQFEKQAIQDELTQQKKLSKYIYTALGVLIVILIIALIIQYRKRQRYKRRFQKILNQQPSKKTPDTSVKKMDQKTIDIQENVIQEILKGLENFEQNQGFLSNKITLTSLAKKLKTNPNYLSKVINHYKKTSFTKYLNTLRVNYSVEQLKTNSTYRKYTIKAIAEEVGFNSVQAFAKAFYKSNGINPSYFLKELKKTTQALDK